jgi:UDP:flavonoid glycosyltransferase YjiC (YdhE family)
VNDRLADIFDEIAPDAIVEDNVVAFAAIPASGRPWARITSCNPLEWKDPAIPPVFSGYPAEDRSAWDGFWTEYDRVLGPQIAGFDAWLLEHGGLPSSGPRDYLWMSPYLNMFIYPQDADYRRTTPLPPTAHRLEASVRTSHESYVDHRSLGNEGSLVYLSLGSLGSADVELMQRLVDVLAKTRHRYIVSKGPQHELITLADNMVGAEFLPQPAILPQADLVITHGGNNTVTESWYFGKPVVVLPLFWDQYDNAQRVDELELGVRLATYSFEDDQLIGAIESLLGEEALRSRLSRMSARLQADPGTVRAADLIERLARTGQPVT